MELISGNQILSFLNKIRNLSSIERCNNLPHIKQYNVAEHSFYVAIYAMIFADIEKVFYNKKYDTDVLLRKALLHDVEECITGDILYPLKHGHKTLSDALFTVINQYVKTTLFEELKSYDESNNHIKNIYISLWKGSKDNSPEGRLVAAMDKFEILIFSLFELELGNKSFSNIYHTAKDILKNEFADIYSLQDTITAIQRKYDLLAL